MQNSIAMPETGTAGSRVSILEDRASLLLNKWYREGSAAGHHGDYYDNRDRGHSALATRQYPQLRSVAYLKPEIEAQRDKGLQRKLLPFPVVGNSSMASAPRGAGSLPRVYYTVPRGLEFLHAQYRSNNLYVYPEHRDHDVGTPDFLGIGDLYPTNTPYLVISQGSSGSDKPFVHAFVKTLAAFRPDVKSALIRTGLLMPTLQAIFRQSNRMVRSRDDYLSGVAHPTVFDRRNIDALEMVRRAHAMTVETIPPLVRLDVVRESQPVAGLDYFEPSDRNIDETLGDTPCVIARIVRGPEYVRRITVSAERSIDINGRPLRFHWVVLRGDRDRIRIDTWGAREDTARIAVPYHHRRPVAPGSSLQSNRVDIGVFAESQSGLSAPCLVTLYTLPNEARVYDDQGRLLEIDYQSPDGDSHIDPRLTTEKNWRDVYQYDGESGALLGWRRHINGETIDFNSEGKRVLKRDSSGTPIESAPVDYVVDKQSGRLEMVSVGKVQVLEHPSKVRAVCALR